MSNKLKEEMEKITMSDKTKESIIAACEEAARNRSIARNDNNEYADHVYGVEKVKPRNRIMRSISAVAACALIAGGIGTTGVLLHKNGAAPTAEVPTTVAENEPVEAVSPFGDFSTLDFSIDTGDGVKNKYDDETQGKLAEFLNDFDWGEEASSEELEILPDDSKDYSGLKKYVISWKEDDMIYTLGIAEIGYAAFNSTRLTDNGGELVESSARKIDFEAFDKGMQEILPSETYDEYKLTDIDIPEDSPFADILTDEYMASPFAPGEWEITREQRKKTAELFFSKTWVEIEDTGEFGDFTYAPDGKFFVATSYIDVTYYQLSANYDDHVCLNKIVYDDEGNLIESEKKVYTCNDVDFGDKLAEIFDDPADIDESKDYDSEEQKKAEHDRMVELVNRYDGGLIVWCEDGGWNKRDLDQSQFEAIKTYFNEHEFDEGVPNTFGTLERRKWNSEFGTSQIQLFDNASGDNVLIYVSKDSSLIAIARFDESICNFNVNIYKAEGLEALQFIRDFDE